MALLPEWTPVKNVLIAWPYPESDWAENLGQATECYWAMLSAFVKATHVVVLLHPSLSKETLQAEAKTFALPNERITWLTMPYDDTWIRDYGPLSTDRGLLSLTFNGWGGKYPAEQDNQVYQALSKHLELDILKHAFVGEGGALETNGSCLLMNVDCIVDEKRNPNLKRNDVEAVLREIFSDQKLLWLEGVTLSGDDTDGHIDTLARFCNARTIAYSGRNEKHVDAPRLASLHRQIQTLAQHNEWGTVELPSPLVRSAIDGHVLPATYANFFIANRHVFMPIYDVDEDTEACERLQKSFAHHTVVPVRCEALLEQHGSLHCATMQILY